MRRFPAGAALLASSLVLMAAPAQAADAVRARTSVQGLTFTSKVFAPTGTTGQWYILVHDATAARQHFVARSAIGTYPNTKVQSVTVPLSAFGTACTLVVQVDVRFGGTTHQTTTLIGNIHRAHLTKPNCTPAKPPVTPPTVTPPTVTPPTVTPPTVTPPVHHVVTPPAEVGVSAAAAAAPARAVTASVTFTG